MEVIKFDKMAPANLRISPLGIAVISIGIIVLIFYTVRRNHVENVFDPNAPTVSLKKLLSASIDLAQKGGVKVREIRKQHALEEQVKGKTLEGANELKTNGDMMSHIQIVHGFKKGIPRLTVVSEEKESKPSHIDVPYPDIDSVPDEVKSTPDEEVKWDDVVVWVDPLDATQEYTEELTQYVTTMVCVVIKGKPIIGVIHNPFEPSTSWAWVGHGHSENLNTPPKNEIKIPKITISRSHAGKMEEAGKKAFPDGLQMIPAGGAGFKVLSLFKGIADAYVHVTKIKKWDICAGNAILNALNGKMTTLEGREIDYSDGNDSAVMNGLLATIHNHQTFLEKIQPVFDEL